MVYYTGDVHGDIRSLLRWLNKCRIPHQRDQIIVLLGDVGVNYFNDDRDQEAKLLLQDSNRTYFCIHGNHERRPENIVTYHADVWHDGAVYVEDRYPHIIFAQDGEVFDLDGLQSLVLGGAYSVDKWLRLQSGYHWFEDEQIPEQRRVEIFDKVRKLSEVDLVLSHTCPFQWRPTDLFMSCLDQSTVDNSMEYWLTEVERNLNYRYWLFGHFHDDRQINDKVQMLFKNVIDLEFLKG